MSPVKRNLKEAVKSRIGSNPGSFIRKIASALNSTCYGVRTTMKKICILNLTNITDVRN